MRFSAISRFLISALLGGLLLTVAAGGTGAEDRCVSWSEARGAGLTEKFKLRSAPEIKADVEKRYGGKVVSFQICRSPDGLIYKLSVYKSDGNVQFVTEPAEPAEAADAAREDPGAPKTGN